jgi:hypothetical protein
MRFYKSDGWKKDELEECLEGNGEILPKAGCPGLCTGYYIQAVGTKFDTKKLRPLVSEVIPGFPEQPTDVDVVLEKYNW